jgi:hypothetical protein
MEEEKRYPSDLTEAEWAILEPLVPQAKPGGPPRTVNIREVVNGIFYVLRGGFPGAFSAASRLPRGAAPPLGGRTDLQLADTKSQAQQGLQGLCGTNTTLLISEGA